MSKRIYVKAEVTEKEREEIREIAKEKGMSISSLILNSIEKNVIVNLDTSNYRDLVLQVKRIGNNINNIIKKIHIENNYLNTDFSNIENQLKNIDLAIKEEETKINQTKKGLENITNKQLKKYLKKEEKEIPNYLILEEIADHIIFSLRSFISLMEKVNLDPSLVPYIDYFIRDFHASFYSYDELVKFTNELDDVLFHINNKSISEYSKVNEDDFDLVMEILNKHRKESD